MKLNLSRSIIIQLPIENCILELQKKINNKSNPLFKVPILGWYQLESNKPNRFDIRPVKSGRGPIVEGFASIEAENSCHVYIRLMPPLWYILIFALIPVYHPGIWKITDNIYYILWLLFWVIICIANIYSSFRLIKGLDSVISSLNAIPAPKKPKSIKIISRKIALYSGIAIIYLMSLAFLYLIELVST